MVLVYSEDLSKGNDPVWNARIEVLEDLHNLAVLIKDSRIVFANSCAVRWLAFSDHADLLGHSLQDILHPDYAAIAELGMDGLAEDGMLPIKLIARTGGELDVEMWVSALKIPGPPVYLVEARDVTEHLRSAKALRSREQRLEGIIKTVADGIITIDDRGCVQTFNPAAERIFGFDAHEIIGKSIRVLIPAPVDEDKRPIDGAEFQKLMSNGEMVGRRKDGKTFPLEVAVREMVQGENIAFTSVVRDISVRKRAEERLRQLAHFDALTGLPNRFLFSDRLDLAVQRAVRHHTKLALAFIDLNAFKPINDRFGHVTGDAVLRQVATRLVAALRKTDTVARLGGDEFVAILEELDDVGTAERLALKTIENVGEPITIGDVEVSVGASVGIAVFPDHARTSEELIEAADRAMYRAKDCGGNAYCFHGGGTPRFA